MFSGATYNRELDGARLRKQHDRIFDLMGDGKWRTLKEIASVVAAQETSVSARLRDFRKEGHIVERRRAAPGKGLHLYRLITKRRIQDGCF